MGNEIETRGGVLKLIWLSEKTFVSKERLGIWYAYLFFCEEIKDPKVEKKLIRDQEILSSSWCSYFVQKNSLCHYLLRI